MADQILSQEEIDALLSAMDSGEIDVAEEKQEVAVEVRSYDLTAQNIMQRGQFDALEEVYDKFVHGLPDPNRRPIPEYLFSLIESNDPKQRAKYSRLWAAYELKICGLEMADQRIDDILKTMNPYAFARLENYYMAHGCFLEAGQLLKNASKLKDIPTTMVNGRYDVICPPINAFRLKQKLPRAKLVLAEGAGHWMGEKPVERELLKAVREFE